MKVRVHSERLRSGDTPGWDFPDETDFYVIAADGETVRLVKNRKRILGETFEVFAPHRWQVAKKVKAIIAGIAEFAGKDGTAIVGMRTDIMTLRSPEAVTFCDICVVYVPGLTSQDGELHQVDWLPTEMTVDADFWKSLEDMEVVEEVMLT